MDSVLRQSKSLCPFLKNASPATLRSMSTTVVRHASPGGGAMTNLQTTARRCPIMGKAMIIQTGKSGQYGLGGAAAIGAIRAMSSKLHAGKAKLHTSRAQDAKALDGPLLGANCKSKDIHLILETKILT